MTQISRFVNDFEVTPILRPSSSPTKIMTTPERMKVKDLVFREDDITTKFSREVLTKAYRVRSEIRQIIEESQRTNNYYNSKLREHQTAVS